MRVRWLGVIPFMCLLVPGAVSAQSVAAVLMVEDEGFGPRQPLTERLGLQLYGELLSSGAYAQVERLKGRHDANQRLAQAICRLAATHDLVDVWLSVHTTDRDPLEMQRLIPPGRRKLRLVYSTACHGDSHERKAWEVLRPRAVVTHVGVNNPLLALPYVLSSWLQGEPIGPSVSLAWRETQLGMRFANSLPGVDCAELPAVSGSRPVVTGERGLTITSGLARACPALPGDLRWSTSRGGSLGLILRALARPGFEVHGHEVRAMVQGVMLPLALPQAALDNLSSIKVTQPARGQLDLDLGDRLEVPARGATMVLSPLVSLWPGKLDLETRLLKVHVKGISARRGILRARIDSLTLSPAKNGEGYQATARIGIFGLIPWRTAFEVGGCRPAPLDLVGPLFRALDPTPPRPGIGTILARVGD